MICLIETTFYLKSKAISKESICDQPHRCHISLKEQEKKDVFVVILTEITFHLLSIDKSKGSICDYPHRNCISLVEQGQIKKMYL